MQFYVEKVQTGKMCVLSGVSFFAVNISAINREFCLKNVSNHPEMYQR